MKRFVAFTFLLLTGLLTAEAQINIPQPSPAASVSTVVGLTKITVEYSRPQMKGRKIFGSGSDFLVPYGQIWRSGANAGTFVEFDKVINFGGKDVAAGRYLIFTKPGASEWDVMLYSDLSLGGNVGGYDKANEVISTKVKSSKLTEVVDSYTINITDLGTDSKSANLQISWENTAVKIPIVASFEAEVEASIAANTKVNPNNLLAAANYYLAAEKNLEQALEWVDIYLATGNNMQQFWNIHVKAQILAKLDRTEEAIKAAETSLAKARANEQGDFGYIKRNEDLIEALKR